MRLNQTVITAMLMLALASAAAPGSARGSADARSQSTAIFDGGCPSQTSAAPVIVRVNAPKPGLDWGDVGIGAAGAIGISLSALAAAVAINQHHSRRRRDPAEARN
jgi:hypothetical protein